MIIDLDTLNSGIEEEVIINENLSFDSELFNVVSIKNLKNIKFNGSIFKNVSDEFILNGNLSGIMELEDSVSLDIVDYSFDIEIDQSIEENLENNQNSIDIIPILWQNIVLEVPLRYTKVNDFSSYSGDGWKLISEEEVKSNNNPFLELSKNFKEE